MTTNPMSDKQHSKFKRVKIKCAIKETQLLVKTMRSSNMDEICKNSYKQRDPAAMFIASRIDARLLKIIHDIEAEIEGRITDEEFWQGVLHTFRKRFILPE